MISHRAAAILWELPGVRAAPIELSLPTSKKVRKPGVILHRATIGPSDRDVKEGLTVTSCTRTIIDVARYLDQERLSLALEDALRRKLTSIAQLRWRLSQSDMTNRPGSKVLRALLDSRAERSAQTESVLEDRFEGLLQRHGIPLPERQYEIRDGDRFVARVDFADPARKLAFEVVGFAYHSGRQRFDREQTRHNSIASLGWDVRYITSEMVDNGHHIVKEIAKELGLTLF